MTAKGYCAYTDVQSFLGVTFTAAQVTLCGSLIEQAEVFIDGETNRAWAVSAQTDERFYSPGYEIYLRYAPVTTVSAVTGRTALGDSETTLTVDVDYEVRSLETGLIYLVSPRSYDRVMVDYTPSTSIPKDISRACTELVANWMQPSLNPASFGLDSYSLPDLTVKFNRSFNQETVPPTVRAVLERYRYRVHA